MSQHRAWWWFAAFALLAAQTLGLAHRVVHADAAAPTHAHGHSHHDHDDGHGASGEDAFALFTDHEDASDCRLYDQLSHADVLPALLVVVSVLPAPRLLLAGCKGGVVVRHAAPLEARGPPPIR